MPPIPTARRLVSRDLHAIRVENIPLNGELAFSSFSYIA